jgi:hypothetical protein
LKSIANYLATIILLKNFSLQFHKNKNPSAFPAFSFQAKKTFLRPAPGKINLSTRQSLCAGEAIGFGGMARQSTGGRSCDGHKAAPGAHTGRRMR